MDHWKKRKNLSFGNRMKHVFHLHYCSKGTNGIIQLMKMVFNFVSFKCLGCLYCKWFRLLKMLNSSWLIHEQANQTKPIHYLKQGNKNQMISLWRCFDVAFFFCLQDFSTIMGQYQLKWTTFCEEEVLNKRSFTHFCWYNLLMW